MRNGGNARRGSLIGVEWFIRGRTVATYRWGTRRHNMSKIYDLPIKSIIIALCLNSGLAAQTPCYEFVNGFWFNGDGFEAQRFYSSNGMLATEKPARVDSVIDLGGQFVIPPLAEAHIHHLNDPDDIDNQIQSYLEKGIFYVMVQDAIFRITPAIRDKINRLNTVDAVFAEGVLIAPWYDSVLNLYTMIYELGVDAEKSVMDLDGEVLFMIATADDIEEKWASVLTKNRHFLKVLLAFSNEFKTRKADPKKGVPGPGIDPALLPIIVQKAHTAGRRVSVHVETAADVVVAANAGADLIAHLPGWRIGAAAGFQDSSLERWKFTDEDAKRISQTHAIVITTTLPKTFLPDFDRNQKKFTEIHRHNLRVLAKNGVPIAIGSDNRQVFVPGEIDHIRELDVFDNLTLLKMAVETTPLAIFPTRRIGALKEGFEASFLVLKENPLEDLNALRRISLRIKQGILIVP